MKSCRLSFVFLVALVFSSVAQAQSSRVFASARTGNDANLCNNINTPCQSLAGAVAQVAAGGEVIVLDTGGYGPATITKALSIEANGITAFIHPGAGDALTINAGASDVVVIRGLTLNGGPGSGIVVNTVGALHVENCVISGFSGGGLSGTGIQFNASGQLFVKDTIIRNNRFMGIWIVPSSGTATASIDRCRLENNQSGLFCYPGAKASIRNSVASGNTNIALGVASAASAELNIERCLIANNFRGATSNTGTVRISNSIVTDNGTGLGIFFGTLLSRVNNTVEGNTTDGAPTGTYLAK